MRQQNMPQAIRIGDATVTFQPAGHVLGSAQIVVESGGTRIVAIGRREILGLYEGVGLKPLNRSAQSGAVTYELLSETIQGIQNYLCRIDRIPFAVEERFGQSCGFAVLSSPARGPRAGPC